MRERDTIHRILSFIVDSKLLISLAAVCLYQCSVEILGIQPNIWYVTFLFISTWAIYLYPIATERIDKILQIRMVFWVLLLFCTLTAYLFVSRVSLETFGIGALLGIITLFYYLPVYRNKNLRNVPFAKIFVISLSWSFATVSLPASLEGKSIFENHVGLLSVERFFFLFAITLPFDIRDMNVDKRHGLKTIPMVLGPKNSLYLSSSILCLYLMLSFWHYNMGSLFISRIGCVAVVLLLLAKISPQKSRYYYTGLLDGTMVFQYVLFAILS